MTEKRPYNKALGRLRKVLLAVLMALLLISARPTMWNVAVGSVLVIVGESIRFWAAGYLLKTKELVTAGPYRYSRNPLYLGRLLIFTGLAVMANLPWYASLWGSVLGWIVFFGYYLRRKERVEPARLVEIHGEPYQRYFEAVPALFPSLRPYEHATDIHWSRARMLRNREHLMVIGLGLVLVVMWGHLV